MLRWLITSALTAIIITSLFTVSMISAQGSAETRFELDEEQPAGTIIGSVRDSPALRRRYLDDGGDVEVDVVDRMRFTFRHRQSSSPYEYFAIDEQTGEIQTRQRIDRELVCPTSKRSSNPSSISATSCKLVLDVSVRPLRYFQILKVVVEIRDVNDNAPRFSESRTTIQVPEMSAPGTSFELPSANDDDAPPNGIQNYFLSEPSELFQLEIVGRPDITATSSVKGRRELRRRQLSDREADRLTSPEAVRLVLKGVLDRELAARHRVTIVAVDGGSPPRSGSAEVEIIVVDVNDNAPHFERASYRAEVPENRKARTPIMRLRASDADEADSGSIVYGLIRPPLSERRNSSGRNTEGDSLFRIDPDTGDLFSTRSLDREVDGDVFHLTAVASDRGSSPLSTFVRVTIVVRDENDNAPEVTILAAASSMTSSTSTDPTAPEIAEHSSPGTFVAQVIAVDRDEGPNGSVECWTDGRQFRLEPVALASANEENAYSRNQRSPKLELEDVKEIEDAADDSPANDEPRGRREYRSAAQSSSEGRAEYQLRTVVSFDRETSAEVLATVFCRDAGNPPLRVAKDLVVRVGDINDHAPVIVIPASGADRLAVEVAEGNAIGAVVYRITVTDADLGDNARVEFAMEQIGTDANDIEAVTIERHTGVIRAEINFDYETHSRYDYLITVTDRAATTKTGSANHPRLSATATLVLRVRDVDDERPRFDRSSYHFAVRENAPLGTNIGRLSAKDADVTPRFNRVAYHIVKNSKHVDGRTTGNRTPFDVDRQTGEISTSGRIDREEKAVFQFTVVAVSVDAVDIDEVSDDGSASVMIYVDDENDNAPLVRYPSYVVWIHSGHLRNCHLAPTTPHSGAGCFITRIEASDADEGENARLTYEITASSGREASKNSTTLPPLLKDLHSSLLSLFAIDSSTGVVTFCGEYSAVNVGRVESYRLGVTVRDNGQPQRMTLTDLTVRVNTSSTLSTLAGSGKRLLESDGPGSLSSLSSASSSADRLMIVIGMVCGVVVVTLVASTLCCFFVLRRRAARRDADKAKRDVMRACDGAPRTRDSISGESIGAVSSSLVARTGGSGALADLGALREQTNDECNSCALDVGEWRHLMKDDPEEATDRTAELMRADFKYRQMLGAYFIHPSSNSVPPRHDSPDTVTSHTSSAHVTACAAGASCSDCSRSRHHGNPTRRGSRSTRSCDVTKQGRRLSSPSCGSGCGCSDGGSVPATARFARSATWRTSMNSSPDSLVDVALSGDRKEFCDVSSLADTDSELSSTSTCIDSGMAPSECSCTKSRPRPPRRTTTQRKHNQQCQQYHQQHHHRHHNHRSKAAPPSIKPTNHEQTPMSGTRQTNCDVNNDVNDDEHCEEARVAAAVVAEPEIDV